MKNKLYRTTLFIIIIALTTAALSIAAGALGELPASNSKKRHIVCGELSGQAQAYYTGEYSYKSLITLSGASDASTSYSAAQNNELYSALQSLMSVTHTYYSSYSGYSKGSLAYFWASTDAVESSPTYVMFYSDLPADDSIKLNREHIWPKSRASYGEKNGGSDLHHLRPSVDKINSAKSDHLFGNINGVYESGITQVEYNDTVYAYVHKANDLFECKDDVKGDVARILLYVYCRWGQPNLYTDLSAELLPENEKDSKSNSGKKVVESLDTLLNWCESDPVDTWEMERNDLVQDIQGNRNVFIDYPELAWLMFGREIPDDMMTPSSGDTSGRIRIVGDTDGDGEITMIDAAAIQRAVTLVPLAFEIDREASDVNGDGLDIADATAVQRFATQIPVPFNIGEPIS